MQTESVQTLKQYLSHNGPMDYHVAERMVMDLGAQMAALAGIGKGIMFFSLDLAVLVQIAKEPSLISLHLKHEICLQFVACWACYS